MLLRFPVRDDLGLLSSTQDPSLRQKNGSGQDYPERGALCKFLRLNVATCEATLFQILLVVVLGGIEGHGRNDLSRDGLGVNARFFQFLFEALGLLLLLVRMKKDRGAILRAPVWTLAIDLGRIVVFKEHFQQLRITQFGGIELNFDGFGMTGAVGADIFIGRVKKVTGL